MRALIHSRFGEAEDVLAVEERPVPEPAAGQVRLRIVLSPIHNHDLWTVRGTYGFKPELPAASGTEALGIVDALGEGVEHLVVGQRVATGGTFGAWAEYIVANAAGLIPVPDSLSDESAAQLVSMPFSTISLLQFLDVNEGDWIVQNAANGAVGRMLAQLGAARGVHVLGLVRRAEGVEELRAQGIDNVISTDQDDWREQAARLTGGAPILAGVDSVGGSASGDVLSLLSEGGTLVAFGAMNSPVMEIASSDVIFKQAIVKGFWGSKVIQQLDAATRGALFGELIQRVTDGTLTLPVAGVFDAAEIADAVRLSMTPGRVGKVLLKF
ncbi:MULTISPECIES: zinc-binding dehydrogenase [Microbacterium]|uniref:Zinc-binding dehydrogenase n=2 Tax=Microbacterium maritypicum TaxID=33918 RepID=A0AAJ5SHS9_MICMQ|nr:MULTISPECIES: zinc-binding dehydrogenase [Microbacterium]EYT59618.1 NADPH:quinone oxidoreductase [Microbacterium sp. UCD-TDU]UTT51624.1 zinc-binding dehydrogenase [Microbacterium liquefaciens]WEF19690.1 zinc-binding dehydrogenase [Microbacterium liquefaciens]